MKRNCISNVLQRGIYLCKSDPRNQAYEWIQQNIPSGSHILLDENGPQLLMTEEELLRSLKKTKKSNPKGQFTAHYETFLKYQLQAAQRASSRLYNVTPIRQPWWRLREIEAGVDELTSYDIDMANPLKPPQIFPYQYYVDHGYDYAVVHSEKYGEFFEAASDKARRYPSFARFYRELFRRGELIKEFSLESFGYEGPTVKIFKIHK